MQEGGGARVMNQGDPGLPSYINWRKYNRGSRQCRCLTRTRSRNGGHVGNSGKKYRGQSKECCVFGFKEI